MFAMMKRNPVATISINMKPVRGPWGGSSVFVEQLSAFLESRGYRVQYDLCKGVDLILLIDPRTDNRHKRYGPEEIRAYKHQYPKVKVLHRINECDQRKSTGFMDALLREASELADHTVFISSWLRDYFIERWFDPARPNTVVYNGADGRIFHPVGSARWNGEAPLRVVTHHWSDNPMKGFPVYAEVDRLIAEGALPGFELHVIGRWPMDIKWTAAHATAPCSGSELAQRLRSMHLYLTASQWEPCGMHHIEGAQCGLPLICQREGGGIVEAAERYGVVFGNDVRSALIDARLRYLELRERVLQRMPDGLLMCRDYERVIRTLLMGA